MMTRQRNYDLAVSLGGACGCSKSLRNANLQFASFPFDWLNGATLRDRADLISCGFAGWLEDGLDKRPEPDGCIGESHWQDRRYGFGLLHDFDRKTPMETALPGVKEKYARRTAHLFRLVGESRRVLLVWTDVPTSPLASDADLKYLQDAFRTRWPNVTFDVLAFRRAEGVELEDRTDTESDGIRIVTFDYMDKKVSKYGVLLANDPLLGKWLAAEYAVRDYRTAEEKKRWKRVARQNVYRQFGGTNWLGYFIGRTQYKVYKHLKKALQKKGVV